MHYSLGSFPLNPSFSNIVSMAGRLSRLGLQRHLEALSDQLRSVQREPPTDLLTALAADDPDRGWLAETALSARQLRADGARLDLIACDHTPGPDGECCVVFVDRARQAAVRVDDDVQAGVAILRSPATGLCVMPRVFRKVCSNGAVLDLGNREATVVEWHEVDDAIRACLAPERFADAVARFRWATTVEIDDIAAFARVAGTVTAGAHLVRRAGETERSLFAVLNAATERAHLDLRWSARLDRERDAERLLAAAIADSGPLAWDARMAAYRGEPAAELTARS